MSRLPGLLWILPPFLSVFLYGWSQSRGWDTRWLAVSLQIYVLFFSVVIHELAHGLAARFCGDTTAERAGRLTLNPVSHVSPVGSVILPLALHFMHAPFMFGWAKPVPFNPANLRRHPRDQVFLAMAGPLSNFFLSFISFVLFVAVAAVVRTRHPDMPFPVAMDLAAPPDVGRLPLAGIPFTLLTLFGHAAVVNAVLGVFNLLPIPPLDGSWVLKAVLPPKLLPAFAKLQAWGFVVIVIIVQIPVLGTLLFAPALAVLAGYGKIAGWILQ